MKLKRIISLALVAALSVPFMGTIESKADTDGWSVKYENAPVVQLNTEYDLGGWEAKFAKIILPKSGYIDVTVNFPAEGKKGYEGVKIYSEPNKKLVVDYLKSNYNLGENELSDSATYQEFRAGLSAGEYVLEIVKGYKSSDGGSFRVDYVPTDSFEQEINEKDNPTPIPLGKKITGNKWGDDGDSYAVRISNVNPVKVYIDDKDVYADLRSFVRFYSKNSVGALSVNETVWLSKDSFTFDSAKNAWYVSYKFEEPGEKVIEFYAGTPYKVTVPYTIEITQAGGQSAVDKAISDAKIIIAKGYCARIRNKRTNDHIFTVDPMEAETLLKQSAIYEHETNADGSNSFLASKTQSEMFDQPVYRLFHKKLPFHNYTYDSGEVKALLGNGNWTADKGTAPVFYTISKPYAGSHGIYRAFKAGKQHYCPEGEYKGLIKNSGWQGNNEDKPYWYTN